MRIRAFEYHAARDLRDALEKMEDWGPQAKILAGGTDLVPALKNKQIQPSCVISLHRLRELDYVRETDSQIRIGAMAKHGDLAANPILKRNCSILCEAVSLIGSWQIRNVATIGGNLCTASPAADSAGPLLVLDARAVITGLDGEKEIPLASFFRGPGETVLQPNQLLKEIVIELPKSRAAGCYLKLMRKKAVDLSLAGVAFQAELDGSETRLARVAIGLGGVAPTPIRAREAEQALEGLTYEETMKKAPEAARHGVEATRPISDLRASASYRRAVVEVYVQRAIEEVSTRLFRREGMGR
jgi:CO/xanthine dehydrogenase FAD-binding subunit